jgi:hypothetical protein
MSTRPVPSTPSPKAPKHDAAPGKLWRGTPDEEPENGRDHDEG